MHEATIQAPGRTVTVEEGPDSSNEEHRREIDIQDIDWEDIYWSTRRRGPIPAGGWIKREDIIRQVEEENELSNPAANRCVEIAIEEGVFVTRPDDRSRIKVWEVEEIELGAGGEISIRYLGDYTPLEDIFGLSS